MTIIQLIQKPQLRGAEIFAAQLSQNLTQMGHKVILVSLFEGKQELPFDGKIINLQRSLQKRTYDIAGWKKLSEIINEYKPDIVQANAGDTLKWAVLSKKMFGWNAKLVARNASTVSNYIKNSVVKELNRWLYKQTDGVVSVAQFTKTDLISLFPELTSKVSIAPIGIDLKPIRPIGWKNEVVGAINVVHVGGFSFEKNHRGLLRIWSGFIALNSNAQLHLIGEGVLKNEVEEIVRELELKDNVQFYGAVPNPLDYMANADVVVLPSIIEGLPGVLLEAMSAKTPVVSFNVGGISEIVKNGTTGYLVEKNNEKSFVKAVNNAFISDNTAIVENAYDMVTKEYSNNIIAKKFEEIYVDLIKRYN